MRQEYQDLASEEKTIENHLKAGAKRGYVSSMSALFRKLRRTRRISFVGDWPILSFIIHTAKKQNISFTLSQIKGALRYSKEYKDLGKAEKMRWAVTLYGCQAETTK